ncbi:hypothetical protein AFULGI_00015970 [Archaeoglobus fulgidus DSM 8774]|jgi:hypothetical protein|uniref:Uncharacterized protein n=1 Tax=Archaeoglobus fulgidus DSM 8774 TaxID=1344584 RepID=A0A075WGY1_ARCFL|nr:pilin [Archaeoglobus fulgidus]AIG98359.1 hypothetical protein AFULGI_00015970 [Archaeoglobus fulgidus DSM 8774]
MLQLALMLRGIATAALTLALMWGGIRIMTSGGDAKAMQEGKNIVKNAVIGYIIAMLASLIPAIAPPNIEPIYFDLP